MNDMKKNIQVLYPRNFGCLQDFFPKNGSSRKFTLRAI